MWACLDEELVAPAIERLKGLGTVHVVDEDTAVGTTVERDAERLEALLTSSIPQLSASEPSWQLERYTCTYLHRHKTVIDHNLLREAVKRILEPLL